MFYLLWAVTCSVCTEWQRVLFALSSSMFFLLWAVACSVCTEWQRVLFARSSSMFYLLWAVACSKIGHFRPLHWRPSWPSCINEYLPIDSGGNVSDLVVARNCCMARMLPGEAELVSEWTGLSGRAKSVKRVERSNGLDTALYKNYLYLYVLLALNSNTFCLHWAVACSTCIEQ